MAVCWDPPLLCVEAHVATSSIEFASESGAAVFEKYLKSV